MERNVKLYPYLQVLQNLLFWMPVFFLYFASVVRVDQVLLLEAVYFLAVVVLEVPSGYFSDRIGRRLTLLISALAPAVGCAVFVASGSFALFLVAQLLFAVGMAFKSGTDTSLLYESLKALGRQREFIYHEGRAQTYAFSALGVSALVGGLLAGFDLRIAYALSGLGAVGAFALVLMLREPPSELEAEHGALMQLAAGLRPLREPVLRWVLLFAVSMTVLEHVPYEFLQPYVQFLLGGEQATGYAATPLVAGVLLAATMGLAALASRRAASISVRLGAGQTLLLAVGVEIFVIGVMASVLHFLVLLPMLLRSAPSALMRPVMNAIIHERLPNVIRATYFSIQSFAGRLAFSATLALAAWGMGASETLTPGGMQGILVGFLAGSLLLMPLLVVGAIRISRLHPR